MKKIFILCLFLGSLTSSIKANDNFITHVTLTTYNATKEQCDATPGVCSSGRVIDFKKLKQGKLKYCAVSRDLLGKWGIMYNDIIEIEGFGRYEVVDTMHPRFKHYIDILQHTTEKPFKLDNVKIKVVKRNKK